MIRHVAIIGAGFAGTLQAINLLRHDGPRATLIERGAFPGAVERIGCGARSEGPLITLRADRALDYGRVMAVMGELNRAGCNSISLVTQGSVEAP